MFEEYVSGSVVPRKLTFGCFFLFFFLSEKKDFLKDFFFLLCYDPQLLFSFVHGKKKSMKQKKSQLPFALQGAEMFRKRKKKIKDLLVFFGHGPHVLHRMCPFTTEI